MVRRLRSLAARGVPASVRFLLPKHPDVVAEALSSFGSFARAREAARLESPAPPATDHDVIEALRILYGAGTRLDPHSLIWLGEAGLVAAAARHFGSLDEAARAAGLAVAPSRAARSNAAPAAPIGHRAAGKPAKPTVDRAALFAAIDEAAARAGAELKDALTEAMLRFAAEVVDEVRRDTLLRLQGAVGVSEPRPPRARAAAATPPSPPARRPRRRANVTAVTPPAQLALPIAPAASPGGGDEPTPPSPPPPPPSAPVEPPALAA